VSISRTPSVSISRTPSKSVTPPASPPAARSSFDGSLPYVNCTQACAADSLDTTYWAVGGFGTGITIYTSEFGSTTISGGSYYTMDNMSTCYFSTGTGQVQADSICCVIEGTLISTSPSSSVAVETLAISDEVLSKNINLFDDDMTVEDLRVWSGSNIDGSQAQAIVTANVENTVNKVLNFNNGLIKTTTTHTHVVKRGTEWITRAAKTIQVGDYFENQAGALVEITSIVEETGTFNVYTLNVETDDVYYAGGILTHNDK